MKYDYLIVGQGLAGSILSYQLLQRGRSVAIVDEMRNSSSSYVAAGLINPFTGPRMVKSWKAEVLFPFLQQFYLGMEHETGVSFYRQMPIYRPFKSFEELNDWDGRSTHPNYQKFVWKIHDKNSHAHNIEDPFGGLEVSGAVLNMPIFIRTMRKYLSDNCTFFQEQFEEEQLRISEEEIAYKQIKARELVFCTGYQAQKSKFFGWIPLAPVKGEILHLKLEWDFETIYNKSGFIIPQGNGLYKAGSTYDRNDLSEDPTEAGKNEISKKLDALLKMNYTIVNHEAGIRPGTIARRPIVGRHPKYERLSIFNGLGTKGVSLAPYFGDQLIKCLEEGNYLDEEVDIKKYYSLYFNSHFSI
jgi:glycine/D-amino acid oxidase-like deaminating enzyme